MTGRVLAFVSSLVLMVGGGVSAAAQAAQAPRAALQSFVCQRAANPLNRAISVTAVMRPLAGTQRMELRFALERRPAGQARSLSVHGRYLGIWLRPDNPTLGQRPSDVWVLNKPVVNLAAPATYWFRVTFRWRGSSGVIGTQTQVSARCHEPAR